jgi:hypothetical protein
MSTDREITDPPPASVLINPTASPENEYANFYPIQNSKFKIQNCFDYAFHKNRILVAADASCLIKRSGMLRRITFSIVIVFDMNSSTALPNPLLMTPSSTVMILLKCLKICSNTSSIGLKI